MNPVASTSLSEMVGSQLKSVEFVHDYIQFDFNGPRLITLTLPSIRRRNLSLAASDSGYREALLAKIGAEVADVVISAHELIIGFADSDALCVSLRDDDYSGPEAVNFLSSNGHQIVF